MNYFCRRILLKDLRDETGGHVRLESDSGGCAVNAQAAALPAGARLLLLRADGGVRDAGTLGGGRLNMLLRGEDASRLVGAVAAEDGRVLLYGGEGIGVQEARAAASQARPRETASRVPAQESAVPAPAEPPETQPEAQEAAEPLPAVQAAEAPAEPVCAQAAEDTPPGWTVREAGDGLRFEATRTEPGEAPLTVDAVRACSAPFPPPGIPDAVWQEGFFALARETDE